LKNQLLKFKDFSNVVLLFRDFCNHLKNISTFLSATLDNCTYQGQLPACKVFLRNCRCSTNLGSSLDIQRFDRKFGYFNILFAILTFLRPTVDIQTS